MYRLNIKILMAEVEADIMERAVKNGATDEEIARLTELMKK